MKRYVQHMSGQGSKWEVVSKNFFQWGVSNTHPPQLAGNHWLPKSEYRLCDQPEVQEVWKDVTAECDVTTDNDDGCRLRHERETRFVGSTYSVGYRLRKVIISTGPQGEPPYKWGFIVERKVTE